jgi:protease IV
MRCFLLLGLVSSSALAQVDATVHNDLSRGITLLPESTAYAGGATAPVYNPAGISHTGMGELFYAHERSLARGLTIDGLYGGINPLDIVGLGLSVEWLRGSDQDHRKTAFTLGVGGEALSAGISFNWFNQGPVDGMTSVDLGLQSRFSRYVSFGAAIKNVDDPTRLGLRLPRRWDFGIGIRPLRERITLGVDYVFDEVTGPAGGRMGYSLNANIISGLRLYAGVSHGFSAAGGVYVQAGLEVDTSHFGVGYAGAGATNATGLNHLAFARLTAEKMPALPIRDEVIALVDMAGLGEGSGSGGTLGSLLGVKEADRYLRLVTTLERARNDRKLKGVLLKVESSGIGLARAQELRALVKDLQAHGKVVVALILSCGDAEYVVASAADKVFAVPEAMLQIDGLESSVTFLGDTAQKLGVHFDVARVGAYKNSPDQFTRGDMSAEQTEAINAYLDTDQKELLKTVAESRKLSQEQVQAAIDEGLKPTKRAKELKLIDDIVTPNELEEQLGALIPGARLVRGYQPFDERTGRWGSPTKIAVIPVIGNISGGNDQSDPTGLGLLASSGADTFIRAVDAAASDSDVAAIVVRIDSPGGDGLASDLMYRAVVEARKKKPVITSMGDVAASGGYYVAMGAEEIWASPTTITGSIGVFYLKPSVKELAEKLGVNHVRMQRGALVGSNDYFEPWSDAQAAAAQRWIDAFYDAFITEVSVSRHKDKAEVDKVARGRVWSGEDAKARGLVDQLGGLTDALRAAKARARIGENDDVDYVVYGASGGLLGTLISSSAYGRAIAAQPAEPKPAPAPGLAALAKELGLSAWQLEAGLKAHLGFELKVQ